MVLHIGLNITPFSSPYSCAISRLCRQPINRILNSNDFLWIASSIAMIFHHHQLYQRFFAENRLARHPGAVERRFREKSKRRENSHFSVNGKTCQRSSRKTFQRYSRILPSTVFNGLRHPGSPSPISPSAWGFTLVSHEDRWFRNHTTCGALI